MTDLRGYTIRLYAATIAVAALSSACASDSLSGSSSTAGAKAVQTENATPAPSTSPATDQSRPDPAALGASNIPADCGPDGATQAELSSKTLQNAAPNNFLDYRLALTDCQGHPLPLSADSIWFDVNGSISNFGDSIGFAAADGQSPVVTGTMRNILGSDLFNHSGFSWAHWQTNQAVNFANKNYLTFRIFLGGANIVPLDHSSQLATYLKFGKAAAVTVVVQLTN